MGGRLKTSQLKTSRVDLSVLETCRKSSSIPALLGERRFYFTVFPISPFPFASLSPLRRVTIFDTRAFKISTIVDIFHTFVRSSIPLLESIIGRIFKKKEEEKKKKISILRIFLYDSPIRFSWNKIPNPVESMANIINKTRRGIRPFKIYFNDTDKKKR